MIGEQFEDEFLDGKNTRRRVIRGFLIDGATIPSSSGSPVLLKPVSGRVVHGEIVPDIPPPLLLGIVSETFYAPVKTEQRDIYSFAGLGLVLDAETIKETIELFFE